MPHSNKEQMTLFDNKETRQDGPVTCLGMTFNNDEERRAYFTEELRKKLPELRKIEGFPIGEDEDILTLSDPPYYTACPNPWVNDFIRLWDKEKREYYNDAETEYHREPFVVDVSEGKYDPIYKFHPYPTKVPHKAIMRYILHYTNPGDVIYDAFCGTGSTGVAAQLCNNKEEIESLGYKVDEEGNIYMKNELEANWAKFSKMGARKVAMNDLSPSSSFISYNYNSSFDSLEYDNTMNSVIKEIEKKYEWMFITLHEADQDDLEDATQLLSNDKDFTFSNMLNKRNIKYGHLNYVAWSDVFLCPECLNEVVFWDAAVDRENGKVNDSFNCMSCNSTLTKRLMERAFVTNYDSAINKSINIAKQVPVLISYTFGNQRFVKIPDKFDFELLNKIEDVPIKELVPTNRMPEGREARRNDSSGVTNIHHFYTHRNAIILGVFMKMSDRKQAGFSVTRIASRITKMYGLTYQSGTWGAGGGPLSGTLYIPSLIKELNMINQLKRSIKQQTSKSNQFSNDNYIISVNSSTDLKNYRDSSIDYIFLDPPFGGNLMYSELNFIWESWLKVFTNNEDEAIVDSSKNKSIETYKSLMTRCLKEVYRILKPGRYLTVVFSNTKASVWNSIQASLQDAGFVVANVSALDKQKGSFKAITTPTAVKQDLIISAYKPDESAFSSSEDIGNTEEFAWKFLTHHLKQLPIFLGEKGEAQFITEREPRILYDRTISYFVQKGYALPYSSGEFQAELSRRLPIRDGMVFLENQVAEYDKKRILVKEFSQLSLFVSDETSAIEWIRQQLMSKPQSRQDLHPNYMREIQHIAKHELLPELDQLLEQNFLMYEGNEAVPSQIHTYLSTNFKDLRNLEKDDPRLIDKAKNRWYVPDPNKQVDLEKLRERSLLREFANYMDELDKSKRKLRQFRTEAIRAGFKKAWGDKDYSTIVKVGERLPETVIQEDDKLLMYFDNAQIRLGV